MSRSPIRFRSFLVACSLAGTLTVGVGVAAVPAAQAAPAVHADPEFAGTLTCPTFAQAVYVTFQKGQSPAMHGVDGTVFVIQSTSELTLTFTDPDGHVTVETLPAGTAPGGAAANRAGINGGVLCHFRAVSTDVWSTDGSSLVATMDIRTGIVGRR